MLLQSLWVRLSSLVSSSYTSSSLIIPEAILLFRETQLLKTHFLIPEVNLNGHQLLAILFIIAKKKIKAKAKKQNN